MHPNQGALAMSERHDAELSQVAVGQGRQQVCVDVVVAERLIVLAEPETVQPRRRAYRVPMSGPRMSAAIYTISSQSGRC
jgi:hypothetical protein